MARYIGENKTRLVPRVGIHVGIYGEGEGVRGGGGGGGGGDCETFGLLRSVPR